ncbi:MAG: anti-sigma factor [Sphingorhabdus sp.]
MTLSEDDIALAGEFALGLLDVPTTALAAARISTDGEFGREVEAWRTRFLPMVANFDTPVRPIVWEAINNALPPSTAQENGSSGLTLWRTLTGLSVGIAAILGIMLFQRPTPVTTPAPSTQLVAALGSDTGKAALTARYDVNSAKMLITPVSLDTGMLYPELWVIPIEGTPHSLGIVSNAGASEISISPQMRGFIERGATLAITPEPKGGGPGGKPTGPVIASGKIATI